MALLTLLTCLVLGILILLFAFFRTVQGSLKRPSLEALSLGLVANFFDTLGIGSFAPSTAYIKFRHLVSDDLILARCWRNVFHSSKSGYRWVSAC